MMDILEDPRCDIPREDQKRLISLAPSLDRGGHFPDNALKIITMNNHFNLFVPQERGGMEYKLAHGMRVIEAYARIEGNLGWIVQIGAGGGAFSAYLQETVAEQFLGRPDQVIAGSDFVGGNARPVDGGYRVTGEWKYASGSLHATAFTGNCKITHGSEREKVRAVIVPVEQVTIIKDWKAMGMRATDSHSFRINDVFVPEDHTFVVGPDHLLIKNQLLRLPFLLYARALFVPVLIGVAYRYMTLYRKYIERRDYDNKSSASLACKMLSRVVKTVRQELYQLTDEVWSLIEVQAGGKMDLKYAAMCIETTDQLLTAVDRCHRHTGMEGIRMDSQLNVSYRNIKTASAHYLLNPVSLKS